MDTPANAALLPLTLKFPQRYRSEIPLRVPAATPVADQQVTVLDPNLSLCSITTRNVMNRAIRQKVSSRRSVGQPCLSLLWCFILVAIDWKTRRGMLSLCRSRDCVSPPHLIASPQLAGDGGAEMRQRARVGAGLTGLIGWVSWVIAPGVIGVTGVIGLVGLLVLLVFLGPLGLSEVWTTVWVTPVAAQQQARHRFVAHTIATGMTGGYQAIVTDLNRDGRPDVIGLASRLDELVWFENPGWQKHVLATGLSRMINLAAQDIDGDGVPELAVAHGFATSHETSLGVISLLTHEGDPTKPWLVREIDRTPTAHRVRWADIEGNDQWVLVNAPLVGPAAASPDYRDVVPIFWYRPGPWSRQVVTEAEEGVVHGILVTPWGEDADGDAILSASFLGVHAHRFVDGQWVRSRVTPGDPTGWPLSGSSEIGLGHLAERTLLTTIEPWHGGQVVVYREENGAWSRNVIDTEIDSGHTIATGDFDGDGRDEVVAGDRGDTQSVYLYSTTDPDGETWVRQVVDNGDMAASGCAVDDLNADGRLDIVCIGSGTTNLKWYENVTP